MPVETIETSKSQGIILEIGNVTFKDLDPGGKEVTEALEFIPLGPSFLDGVNKILVKGEEVRGITEDDLKILWGGIPPDLKAHPGWGTDGGFRAGGLGDVGAKGIVKDLDEAS